MSVIRLRIIQNLLWSFTSNSSLFSGSPKFVFDKRYLSDQFVSKISTRVHDHIVPGLKKKFEKKKNTQGGMSMTVKANFQTNMGLRNQ